MSLSDSYAQLEADEPLFSQCKTCQWYARLDPEDRAFFNRKVAESNINHNLLLKACKDSGLACAPSSFRNHCHEHHQHVRQDS